MLRFWVEVSWGLGSGGVGGGGGGWVFGVRCSGAVVEGSAMEPKTLNLNPEPPKPLGFGFFVTEGPHG